MTTALLCLAVGWVSIGALLPEAVEAPPAQEAAVSQNQEIPTTSPDPGPFGPTAVDEILGGGEAPDELGHGAVEHPDEAGGDEPPPEELAEGGCPSFAGALSQPTRSKDLPDIARMTRSHLKSLSGTRRKSVVYATALFCKPCKLLSPAVARLSEEVNEGVDVRMVVQEEDVDGVMEALGVRSYPSILILEGGKVVDSTSGSVPWSSEPPCAHDRNHDRLLTLLSSHGMVASRR